MRIIFILVILAAASSLNASSYQQALHDQRIKLKLAKEKRIAECQKLVDRENERQQSCCWRINEEDRKYLVGLIDKMDSIEQDFIKEDTKLDLKIRGIQ